MAVSIDTVYQRVLTLANKEQIGYITPQEFNLLANHAQMEIFEQYFNDINQLGRVQGNKDEYSDSLDTLEEKISIFEVEEALLKLPSEVYKIGTITINGNEAEVLNSKDFDVAISAPLTSPTLTRPIATIIGDTITVAIGQGLIADSSNSNIITRYIRKPNKAEWAYVVVNDKALYNANVAVDFELHPTEETKLVYKILKLAGVNLKAAEVVQVAQALETAKLQQEKS